MMGAGKYMYVWGVYAEKKSFHSFEKPKNNFSKTKTEISENCSKIKIRI